MAGDIGCEKSSSSYSATLLPWSSRTSRMTWGSMMTPSLATAAATNAICNGVACTSFCPIEAWATRGGSSTISSGKFDWTPPGRSNGTSRSKPKPCETS